VYRGLVMERMQCELLHILPSFMEQYRTTTKATKTKQIDLAPVCTRLVDIVEEIHKTGHTLIDVKPDNLMIASLVIPTASSKNKITVEELAQSIRLIDFGLIKVIAGTAAAQHKENVPTSQVQGTPLYASLHSHTLQTPSRRDDVYAMLYVIGEIILQANAILHHKAAPYGSGTKSASFFPWSQERDDQSLGKLKKEQMTSILSEYFTAMPSEAIKTALFNAHQQIHGTEFAQAPNYDAIRVMLRNVLLQIPLLVSSKVEAAVAKKRTSKVQSTAIPSAEAAFPLRQSARRAPQGIAAVASTRPSKLMKTAPAIHTEEHVYDSDVEMEDVEACCVDDDASVEMMDQDQEDCKPAASVPTEEASGMKFTVFGGLDNQTNETIALDDNKNSILIGSGVSQPDLLLPNLSKSHLRLTLSTTIPNAIHVKPMGKQCLVKVNNLDVPTSGTVVFVGQVITFGQYAIRSLQPFKKAAGGVMQKENKESNAKMKTRSKY
jgi:serine/threonine protein kinase